MAFLFDAWTQPARTTPRQRLAFHAFVTLAVGVLAVAYDRWRLPVITFGVDDAYITLHNAQMLAQGGTDAFGVSGLVGATSAFHVVVIRLLLPFASPLRALCDAEWLAIWAYAVGVGQLAFTFGCRRRVALMWVAALLTVAESPAQLMNGLETGWALALVTWSLVLSHGRERWQRGLFCLVVAQLPFVRPELVAFVPLLVVGTAWEAEPSTSGRLKRTVIELALVGVLMVPWALFYWKETGVPYPTTVPAKRYFFSEACLPLATRFDWASSSVMNLAAMLGPLAAGIVFLPRTCRGRALLAFLVLDFLVYLVQLPGALGHYGYRYQYIAIPMLAYGALRLPKPTGRAVQAFLAFAVAVQALLLLPDRLMGLKNGQRFTAAELVGVTDFLAERTKPGDVILLHDVGYVGYALQGRKLVDIVGLKTPSSIPYHRDLTAPSCGPRRGEATHRIAMANHAQYIVVLQGWDRGFKFVEQLASFGWRTELVRPNGAYLVYKLTPPGSP